MSSVGVVLSGGGARCAAHLGVLKALDELGVQISAVSGVSAGAIVGALYAAGNTPSVILSILKKATYFGVTDFAWFKNGIFKMDGLRNILEDMIGPDSFEALKIPLYVTATDISRGVSVTFSKGELFSTVIASSSVPIIFEPVFLADMQLVDGGILDNLPVGPLIGTCDAIIGVHVNKLYDGQNVVRLNKVSMIEQCFHLAIANTVMNKAHSCHIFIEPLLAGFKMFDMKRADEIFELGYSAAMQQRELLTSIAGSNLVL